MTKSAILLSPANPDIKLSVVIAAWNDVALLAGCLASLRGQADRPDTEIIVASNYDARSKEIVESRFPYVKHIDMPESATVPELRAAGIAESSGEIVALLEDHCVLYEGWCSEIKRAHDLAYSVVGGSVENGSCEKLLDWAVYFYDYGKYMQPNEAGTVDSLSGNNVSYKRSTLEQVEESFRDGFYETFIHGELKRRGHTLYLMPSAIVYHKKSYKTSKAVAECYHHARSFAGMRVVNSAISKRLMFALGSLLLPALLPSRIVLRMLRKQRHTKELLLSLPHLLLLMTSWSVGELCGYAFGAGTSPRRWV